MSSLTSGSRAPALTGTRSRTGHGRGTPAGTTRSTGREARGDAVEGMGARADRFPRASLPVDLVVPAGVPRPCPVRDLVPVKAGAREPLVSELIHVSGTVVVLLLPG